MNLNIFCWNPLCRNAFAAVLDKLNPHQHQFCFELYGLDFMITETGRVFLIEVNTCPALVRHGSLLSDFLPPLIEEASVDNFLTPSQTLSTRSVDDCQEASPVAV